MIYFKMDENGRVTLCSHAITDGVNTIPCETEMLAQNLCKNSRYEGYKIVDSDKVSEELVAALKGNRFDSMEDANDFINEGGYLSSDKVKILELEAKVAELTETVSLLTAQANL